MSESVVGIFKTLVKVPCIIVVTYMIFNLFAFSFNYFRFLGISYVVMQTAAENNYLPQREREQLNEYLDSLENDMVEDAEVFLYDSTNWDYDRLTEGGTVVDSSVKSATQRRQYGNEVIVGVSFRFKPIWPLMSINENATEAGASYSGRTTTDTFDSQTNYMGQGTEVPLTIHYKVPCLRYYPDL